MKNNQEIFRLLFSEIIKGFSQTIYKDKKLYFKHLNVLDSAELDFQRDKFYEKAINNGLISYEEKENFLIKEGLWSEDKNKAIEEKKKLISNLKLTKSKLFKQLDIECIKKDIDKEEKELKSLLFLKNELIGLTAEDYASKRANEYFIYFSLFQDQSLEIKFFSKIDYEDLSDEDIDGLTKIYNLKINRFSNINLKKIGLSPFYLNLFNISNDNIKDLYGRPIINLTYYQIELFYHAKYFKNILSDSKHQPPNEYFNDPDKLIEWIESSKNAEDILNKNNTKNKKNNEFVASSIIGAKQEDITKVSKPENMIDISALAKEKGGTLSMEDFLKIHKA